LIELGLSSLGQGEWQLLAPALRRLLEQPGYLVLINPPASLCLLGLVQLGLDYRQLLLVQAQSAADQIYSFKTTSASPVCLGVLCWEPVQKGYRYAELRKLQLSASKGAGLYVLLRREQALTQSSPACLRIRLRQCSELIQVELHKQRGSFRQQTSTVELPDNWRALPERSSLLWLANENERMLKREGETRSSTLLDSTGNSPDSTTATLTNAKVLPFSKPRQPG